MIEDLFKNLALNMGLQKDKGPMLPRCAGVYVDALWSVNSICIDQSKSLCVRHKGALGWYRRVKAGTDCDLNRQGVLSDYARNQTVPVTMAPMDLNRS